MRERKKENILPCFHNQGKPSYDKPKPLSRTTAMKTPICHSLVVVFVSTEAAAAQQWEEDNQ